MTKGKLSFSPLLAALAIAAIAAGAIAGCGDDDEVTAGDVDGNATSDSKAQFIAQADAICRKARVRTAREFNEVQATNGNELQVLSDFTDNVIIPRLEDRIRGIRSLETPPSAEQAADTAIAGFEQLIEAAEADPIDFQSKAGEILPEIQKAASRQGFDDCAGYLG